MLPESSSRPGSSSFQGNPDIFLKPGIADMVLEICVDSVESAIAAQAGGADRVELCSDLMEGGITPSIGLLAAVRRQVEIGVFVMIRPRGGDSLYTQLEYEVMQQDIRQARQIGADGVVLGVLTADGEVDVPRTRALVELAAPMHVTFHRAFDMTANLETSLEQVIATGCRHVLTSGGMPSIAQGASRVARLLQIAQGRIGILVGGGIRQGNIQKIALQTGATEFHCSLRVRTDSPMIFRDPSMKLGATMEDEFSRFLVRESSVQTLRRTLDAIASGAVIGAQEHAQQTAKDR